MARLFRAFDAGGLLNGNLSLDLLRLSSQIFPVLSLHGYDDLARVASGDAVLARLKDKRGTVPLHGWSSVTRRGMRRQSVRVTAVSSVSER